MTGQKAPVRRCSWHHCSAPAAATVAFQLPNLLAGSRRDYCQEHTRQVRLAKGTVAVAGSVVTSRPHRARLTLREGAGRAGSWSPVGRGWCPDPPWVGTAAHQSSQLEGMDTSNRRGRPDPPRLAGNHWSLEYR